MKMRQLLLFVLSLAMITATPHIQGQTKTLIALKLPDTVSEVLEKYAKSVWRAIHEDVKAIGLEFTTLYAKDMHQTLFWGTTENDATLIVQTDRAIQNAASSKQNAASSKMNPFTGIQIGNIDRFKTALSVPIQGPGDRKAKQIADQIEQYGTPYF